MAEPVMDGRPPRVAFICHDGDRMDAEGLGAWLATSFELVGVVKLRERSTRLIGKVRREVRRVGLLRFLDVLAYRIYYRLRLAGRDAAWLDAELAHLKRSYPADPGRAPVLIADDPNSDAVKRFLAELQPDLVIARCKFILRSEVFRIPRHGTYVLHPGICPEYRNAHGCFWAMVNRDLDKVGMTLLRTDAGVDTGPMLLQASYRFDESRESARVVQYRVVLENLGTITEGLLSACQGTARYLPAEGRKSATWGQPQLSAYLRWKRSVRESLR